MPVTLVLVLAGHSSTRLGGQLIVGGVVSRTVMVWTQLLLLPHWSVAVQVRAMSLVPPQPLLTESLKLTFTKPQPSWAVATPVTLRSEEHTSELQSRLHLVCRLLLEKKNKQT